MTPALAGGAPNPESRGGAAAPPRDDTMGNAGRAIPLLPLSSPLGGWYTGGVQTEPGDGRCGVLEADPRRGKPGEGKGTFGPGEQSTTHRIEKGGMRESAYASLDTERPPGHNQGRQPDSGNPTVRDDKVSLWKRE